MVSSVTLVFFIGQHSGSKFTGTDRNGPTRLCVHSCNNWFIPIVQHEEVTAHDCTLFPDYLDSVTYMNVWQAILLFIMQNRYLIYIKRLI